MLCAATVFVCACADTYGWSSWSEAGKEGVPPLAFRRASASGSLASTSLNGVIRMFCPSIRLGMSESDSELAVGS